MILKAGIDNFIIKMNKKEFESLKEATMEATIKILYSREIKQIEKFATTKEFEILRRFAHELNDLAF